MKIKNPIKRIHGTIIVWWIFHFAILEYKIPFTFGDEFQIKFSFDWEDSELDTMLLRYNVTGVGIFTLTYDLDKPKIMLVYSWGNLAPEDEEEEIIKRRGRGSNDLD